MEISNRGEEITSKSVFEEIQKKRAIAEPTIYKRLQGLCQKGFLVSQKVDEKEEVTEQGFKTSESKKTKGRQFVKYQLVGSAELSRPLESLITAERMQAYNQRILQFKTEKGLI